MKIRLTVNGEKDILFLSYSSRRKLRTEIVKSLYACANMEVYHIEYRHSIKPPSAGYKARILKVSSKLLEDEYVARLLEECIDERGLVLYLLRCYAFGVGIPDYALINAVFIRSPLFDMKRANDMYFKLRKTDVTSSTVVGSDPLDDDDFGLLNMGVSYDGQQD